MSTRSYICKENQDGTISGVYCHWDGYLEHNGSLLLEHYRDPEKIDELIELGDLSCLRENINPEPGSYHTFDNMAKGVCVFYGRDRGERDTNAHTFKNIEQLENLLVGMIEYVYIYTIEGKWIYLTMNGSVVHIRTLTWEEIELSANHTFITGKNE